MDDEEVNRSEWVHHFIEASNSLEMSWKGDAFCANLMGKRVSGSLNLDHTFILERTAQKIQTTLVDTGYDPMYFSQKALSDHEGVYSVISI